MVSSRISCTLAAVLALVVVAANAQRGRTYLEESEYGRRPPPKPQPIDVVSDFPYEGGERAIFHFDEGDEKFLDTIGPLIKGLNEMSGQINRQGQEITRSFSEALKGCRDCRESRWEDVLIRN